MKKQEYKKCPVCGSDTINYLAGDTCTNPKCKTNGKSIAEWIMLQKHEINLNPSKK
jgi:hypothetical protein